ncbi:dynein heavy chain 5, axonemal-like, partial [Clarias magur]
SPHGNLFPWLDSQSAAPGQKRLFITTGTAERLSGVCLFFLRNTDKAITTANVSQDENVTFVANEAKDNVKYLYTLERFFKALGKCTPTNMLAHIPSLLNSILLIQNVSYSYNTSEHMTSIFVKVTNQMVSTCKEYLSQGVTKLWDLDRKEMLTRIGECLQLNQQYRQCFQKIWEDLQQNPTKQKFEFSDNYVFGKFDTFCKRLENIADLATTLETLSALQLIKLEGIEKVHVRFQTIVNNIKSKTYNMLDQRKAETEQKLHLLLRFEETVAEQMDLSNKYAIVLQHFVTDLEQVRKVYKNNKENPPMLRNVPPTPEGKKIIHMYNKLATVLLEYELLYHRAWVSAVERGQQGLNATLLIRHPQTKEICINLDPVVLEVLEEAKYMHKLGAFVPKVILSMDANKAEVKNNHNKLVEMLEYFGAAVSRIPALLQPLMKPFINRVEMALSPGFTILSWTSLNIKTSTKHSLDSLRCRIYESPKYQSAFSSNYLAAHSPLFRNSIELAIPNIILKPSLEEMQVELQATRELADDGPATKQPILKPLDRQIAEHKDIIKTVVQLNTIVFSLKVDPECILDDLSHFSTLWKQDPAEQVKSFLATGPSLPEFSAQLSYYSTLAAKIEDLPTFCTLGFILYDIQSLKLSLTQECQAWKRTYGVALNQLGSTDMIELSSFVDGMTKQLQRPISDLEDVREAMDALKKVCEAEIWIEATIGPVEETFALLHRHELQFSDGNAERVDTLTYGWKTLKELVMQTHSTLELIHPTMKAELLTGVKAFQAAVKSFYDGYDKRIRKLPKALKEWQAFNDLKKKIDDFNETCPLLQMMAHKAMLPRHWQRLSDITGYEFEVDHGNFILKKILEAPLLKNKEDIEDVCISAVKERDIEAKLKEVVAEWSSHQFTFAPFRNRGELLLKGSDTREKVALIEDSLMVLGSLMSN